MWTSGVLSGKDPEQGTCGTHGKYMFRDGQIRYSLLFRLPKGRIAIVS